MSLLSKLQVVVDMDELMINPLVNDPLTKQTLTKFRLTPYMLDWLFLCRWNPCIGKIFHYPSLGFAISAQ
jgi:hypothetical protein